MQGGGIFPCYLTLEQSAEQRRRRLVGATVCPALQGMPVNPSFGRGESGCVVYTQQEEWDRGSFDAFVSFELSKETGLFYFEPREERMKQ